MSLCSNCGTSISIENAKFCPICAHRLDESENASAVDANGNSTRPAGESSSAISEASVRKSVWYRSPIDLIVGMIILVCVGALTVGLVSMNSENNRKQSEASASQASSVEPTSSTSESGLTCSDLAIQIDKVEESKQDALIAKGSKMGCKLTKPEKSFQSQNSTINGITWDWVSKAHCSYTSCFQMAVRATGQSCLNGLYASINLLDKNDTIIGYSNDSLPSLPLGRKAILTFDVLDRATKSAELSKIDCY